MTATADPGLAERKPYVATKLTQELVDGLEQFEREIREELPDRARLHGRVDDLVMLACVLHEELGELEPP